MHSLHLLPVFAFSQKTLKTHVNGFVRLLNMWTLCFGRLFHLLTPRQTRSKWNVECVKQLCLCKLQALHCCCRCTTSYWHWGGRSLLTSCQRGVECGSALMWNLDDIWAGGVSELLFWTAGTCSTTEVLNRSYFSLWRFSYFSRSGHVWNRLSGWTVWSVNKAGFLSAVNQHDFPLLQP